MVVPVMISAVRRALAGLAIAGAVALVPGTLPAHAAGFVNNRAAWLALTPEARLGYVKAMNDSLNYTFSDDTLLTALTKRGRTICLAEKKTTAVNLSELITIAYRADQFAFTPPPAIYLIKMNDICRSQINQARLEFGLGPMQ